MMRYLVLLCLLVLPACGSSSPFWARHMSTEDVEQAERLAIALDEKICTYVRGSGAAYGIEGLVEIIKAEGKGVSFQDCLILLNKMAQPITLPK